MNASFQAAPPPVWVSKGVDFLVSAQREGRWQDYHLPVGVSSEWSSAFITWALALVAKRWLCPAASSAAQGGAQHLLEHRAYACGWGFNATTGPDTDSTACAVAALDGVGAPVPDADRAFLRDAWRDAEGFVTYPAGPGAWSHAHLDVLWPALIAARFDDPVSRWNSLRARIESGRDADGAWHGYWWPEPWYCSFHLLLASRWASARGGHELSFELTRTRVHTESLASAAWLAGALSLSTGGREGDAVFDWIISQQLGDGSWPSAPDLRVTNPEIHNPSADAAHVGLGQRYADAGRLMTTASILRAFCSSREPSFNPEPGASSKL